MTSFSANDNAVTQYRNLIFTMLTHSDIKPIACLEKAINDWLGVPTPLKNDKFEIVINGIEIEVYTFLKETRKGGFAESFNDDLICVVKDAILQESFKEDDDEMTI